MKFKLKNAVFFLLSALVPAPLFAGTGGAWDDEIVILGLAFLFLSGIGVAYLIRYTKEKIIPAMYAVRNPPIPPSPNVFHEEESGHDVTGDLSETQGVDSGLNPYM